MSPAGEVASFTSRFAALQHPWAGAVEVQRRTHHNGSGPSAFGGASSWPAVKLVASLPTGREDLADELVRELAATVEGFLLRHGLDRPAPDAELRV